MQMGVDHDVDIFRRDVGCGQILQQERRLTVDLRHPLRQFVADAGFNQNGAISTPNYERIESRTHAVLLVRWQLTAPQGFGNDPKEGPAVEVVNSVGNRRQLEISQGQALHVCLRARVRALRYRRQNGRGAMLELHERDPTDAS